MYPYVPGIGTHGTILWELGVQKFSVPSGDSRTSAGTPKSSLSSYRAPLRKRCKKKLALCPGQKKPQIVSAINLGNDSKFTRTKLPLRILYVEDFPPVVWSILPQPLAPDSEHSVAHLTRAGKPYQNPLGASKLTVRRNSHMALSSSWGGGRALSFCDLLTSPPPTGQLPGCTPPPPRPSPSWPGARSRAPGTSRCRTCRWRARRWMSSGVAVNGIRAKKGPWTDFKIFGWGGGEDKFYEEMMWRNQSNAMWKRKIQIYNLL